jgi:hypothetical protein
MHEEAPGFHLGPRAARKTCNATNESLKCGEWECVDESRDEWEYVDESRDEGLRV